MFDATRPLLALAPLAGYTDRPFRSVVKKFGVDLTVSEMISSNALVHNPPRTMKMLTKCPSETPFSVQLAGYSETIIQRAVELLNDIDGIDIIDLNCGCPAPKIVGNESGSALLKNPQQIAKLIETIKKTSKKAKTSVKIRIGFESINGVEIAKICENSGADFIAVHGRTRAQKFGGEVNYEEIANIKSALKIPVIANGDINSFEKAQEVLAITKADGIMIGRGAIGAPWIFHQLKHGSAFVDKKIMLEIILEHFDEMICFHGEHGLILFRKHLHTYSKGIAGASEFREIVNKETNIDRMRLIIKDFFGSKVDK